MITTYPNKFPPVTPGTAPSPVGETLTDEFAALILLAWLQTGLRNGAPPDVDSALTIVGHSMRRGGSLPRLAR